MANIVNYGFKIDYRSLPESWKILHVEHITIKPKLVNPRNQPNLKFKYIDVSAISNDSLEIIEHRNYNGTNAPSRARKEIKKGDVIFATVRPSLKRIAIVPDYLDGQVCSTAFCVLRANQNFVDPEYLFYAVSNGEFVSRVAAHERGISFPAVTDKVIFQENVILPPLTEQRKIAHALTITGRAYRATKEIIKHVESLKRSTFSKLLSSDSTKIQEFGDLITDLNHGIYKPSQTITSSGVRILKMGIHFANDQIGSQSMERVQVTQEEMNKFSIQENDLIFARTSMKRDGAGKCSIVIAHDDPIIFDGNLLRARLKPEFNPLFYFYYFNSQHARRTLTSITGGTQLRNISSSNLSKIPVIVPSLEIQLRIGMIISTIDSKIEAEKNQLYFLKELIRTLTQDLLTGRIRLPNLVC